MPSLGELKNALIAAQGQIDRQAQTQRELTETLADLAEQNARLVSAVEMLRLRTRVLVWGGVAMLVWLLVMTCQRSIKRQARFPLLSMRRAGITRITSG